MRIKSVSIVLFVLGLFCSCGSRETVKRVVDEYETQAEMIVKVIDGIDRGRIYVDLPPAVDSLLRVERGGHKGTEVVYFVYSGCSSCIGELLDFLVVIERTGLELPVVIMPSSRHDKFTIEYYIEQTGIVLSGGIAIMEPRLSISELKKLNNRVVVLYDGIPVEGFIFR